MRIGRLNCAICLMNVAPISSSSSSAAACARAGGQTLDSEAEHESFAQRGDALCRLSLSDDDGGDGSDTLRHRERISLEVSELTVGEKVVLVARCQVHHPARHGADGPVDHPHKCIDCVPRPCGEEAEPEEDREEQEREEA